MNNAMKRFMIMVLILPVFYSALGQSGRAGFDFLRIEKGGRPVGMGGAFTATTSDLHGIVYNPASLAGVDDMQSAFTYLNHFADIHSGLIGFNKSLDGAGQVGIGVFYMSYGEMQRTDVLGESMGSFSPADFVVSGTYSDAFSFGLRYGVTLKYVHSKIDQYTSNAIAVDAGVIYSIVSQNLNVGFSVSNLGQAIEAFIDEKEKLPMTIRLGVSKGLAHLPLVIHLDFIRYQHQESELFGGLYWALGGEFTISENFFLRGGYNSRGSEEKVGSDSDRFAGVSLGFGFRFRKMQLDYGFGSYGALGNMNVFTVNVPF